MKSEYEQSREAASYPKVGDMIRLNPGQRKNPESEEWVVGSVEEHTFSAGKLDREQDGTIVLMAPTTFRMPEFSEVIGHMNEEEMLTALFKWYERFGALTDELKIMIKTNLEKEIENQFYSDN